MTSSNSAISPWVLSDSTTGNDQVSLRQIQILTEKRGEEVWVISAEDAAKYAQSEFVQMEQLARELHLKSN